MDEAVLLFNSTGRREKYDIQIQIENPTENQFVYILHIIKQNIINDNEKNMNQTDELIHTNYILTQPIFRKGASYFKFKSFNSTSKEKKKSINKSSFSNEQAVHNPCYLKGYFNSAKNMMGTGNFQKCYGSLLGIITKDKPMNKNTQPSQKENSVSKFIIIIHVLDYSWQRFQRTIRFLSNSLN